MCGSSASLRREFNGALGADGKRRLMMWLPLATRSTILAASQRHEQLGRRGAVERGFHLLRGGRPPPTRRVAGASDGGSSCGRDTRHQSDDSAARRRSERREAAGSRLRRRRHIATPVGTCGKRRVGFAGLTTTSAAIFATLGIVATLVLLVVCTNVAALVISAAVGRRQEIAVRLSLGRIARASDSTTADGKHRARDVRRGARPRGLLGSDRCALANSAGRRSSDPISERSRFTMCVALGTGILCGLAPALHATRDGVAVALKDTAMGATRRSRLQHTFVVAQVMFTQPLLLLIALLIGSSLMEDQEAAAGWNSGPCAAT